MSFVHLRYALFIFCVSIFISHQDISAKDLKSILTLNEVQSITDLLIPQATSTLDFKTGACPKSILKDDDLYFLHTINKSTGLPMYYVPKNLVDIRSRIKTLGNFLICMTETSATHLYQMSKDMKEVGLNLSAVSGYRSYSNQQSLYNIYAPTMNVGLYHRVAPAGHSEHQLGTTVDVSSEISSGVGFGFSPESIWLKENAHKYGFIVSYEEGHEDKTGYMYEPWHMRYVGTENAKLLRAGDYSLAYKPIYYKKTWMNILLGRLKDFTQNEDAKDVSIGG